MHEKHGRIDTASLAAAVTGHRTCSSVGAFPLLPTLIWHFHANVIIEVGVRFGYTTAIFADTLAQLFEEAWLFPVDIEAAAVDVARGILSRYPSVHGTAHQVNSQAADYVDMVRETPGGRARLILIDGSPLYEAVAGDIAASLPALADDGVFVFHDYVLGDGAGVIRAIDEAFRPTGQWDLFAMPTPLGKPFAIVRRRASGTSQGPHEGHHYPGRPPQ